MSLVIYFSNLHPKPVYGMGVHPPGKVQMGAGGSVGKNSMGLGSSIQDMAVAIITQVKSQEFIRGTSCLCPWERSQAAV